ncbi:hypothetical protein ACFOEY_09745 [Paracandidimonas soli]
MEDDRPGKTGTLRAANRGGSCAGEVTTAWKQAESEAAFSESRAG